MKQLWPEKLNRFMPLIVILLVSALLSFWVRDFVRQVIVEPLLRLYWYISLVFESIPDVVIWLVFIVVFSIIALRSLRRGTSLERQRPGRYHARTGAVTSWAKQVYFASGSGYAQWQLAQSLSKLSWSLLQDDQDQALQRIEKGIKAQVLGLPPDIQAYCEAGLEHYSQPLSRLKRRSTLAKPGDALALDPERIVAYLEERLDPENRLDPAESNREAAV